jgi:uncharacterized hydrophobic protein (TIGR00271 family)
MTSLAMNDLPHLRDAVFFEGDAQGQKLSRFWLLLILAAIIATAGVAADSTATVIGAMIVAPLMTPIMGTMLAIVLSDRTNLGRCLLLVVFGAAAVIVVGYLSGLVLPQAVVAPGNSQVAGRINPRLVDLVAAIATGAVGSVALARRDISDTLPGVAIAISLVPPLAVVGLTLAAGAVAQAVGAMLLFVTNVTAILATGTVVMAVYRVYRLSPTVAGALERGLHRTRAVITVFTLLLIVGAALTHSSLTAIRNTNRDATVRTAVASWTESNGWEIVEVGTVRDDLVLRFEGPPPSPDVGPLRDDLVQAGIDPASVIVELVPRETIDLGRAPP